MASESYIRNASSAIENDLKIFVGKKTEILDLKNEGKLVPNKFYLAWDAGEIYFTSQSKKLIKYGGSNENLDENDVRELITSCTAEELQLMRNQIAVLTDRCSSYKTSFISLQNDVTKKVTRIEQETKNLIMEKVNEVLSDAASITYSKEQIDSRIAAAIRNNDSQDDSKYATKEQLSAYITSNDLTSQLSNRMVYDTGNNIANYVARRLRGTYFCIQDSTDSKYQKAHLYYLNGVSYEDLTPEGTGTGGGSGSYTVPTIAVRIANQTSTQITIGGSFSGAKSFTFALSDPDKFESDLSFFEPNNAVPILTVSPTETDPVDFIASLTNLDVGKYQYTLSGQDKKGNFVSGSFTVNVIAPIYYGTTTSMIAPVQSAVQSTFASRTTSSVTGTYNITARTNEYIWICTPDLLAIDSFTLNGFMAPFENPVKVRYTFNGVTNDYNCYRSSEALDASVVKLNIVGS